MSILSDQAERDRFITANGKNISVIAPAGVGKTHAIVDRIVAMARQPEDIAVDRLSRLVVVTYSVRAAQQMQQRARIAIREAGVSPRVQRAFQQTFFGTIHSYCVRLLERFGHYLGLPSPVALLLNHDEWWNRFLTRGLKDEAIEENLQELFNFYSPEKLYALGREISPREKEKVGPAPTLNLGAILAYKLDGLHSSTKRSLSAAQSAAQRWSEAWAKGDRFYPLPKCPETKQAAFVELWADTFAPLHRWLRLAALEFGRRIANAYEKFRLEQAIMTYDDQVRLALRLLNEPAVQLELAQDRPSVLLDEAQDTDPRQFDVLLRAAGLAPGMDQPEDQSFCIVGDFQQAIYAPRSNLSVYQRVHEDLVVEPRGASSKLEVTFRCDEAVISFVNRVFPSVLHGEEGQSAFFRLTARQDAGPGQVGRWLCPDEPSRAAGQKVRAEIRARHEAKFIAERIEKLGFAGLGAESWLQVAILCPRKIWLQQIAHELNSLKIPVQFHSSDETQNDRTPAAWLTALIWVAAHPEDSFEVVGVLREIFGVSDHDLAHFTQGDGERLRLDLYKDSMTGPMGDALATLIDAVADAAARPLHLSVERILQKTKLRERLASIREFEPENAEDDLDELLAAIMRRTAEGATLAEVARELRLNLQQGSKVEEEVRDAIQLMTSHKAKGLEWQTVIVPYMFRAIETRTLAYPRLVYEKSGEEMIYRDKADYTAHAKDFINERERQQLQRLLYVTCTRAKQNLLFVDDETLFTGQVQRGGWSSAELLGFLDEENRPAWDELRREIAGREASARAEIIEDLTEKNLPDLSGADLQQALAFAREIPRRTTPHALASHPPLESEPERKQEQDENHASRLARSTGILYGTWWHELVQSIPWRQPASEWKKRFSKALDCSPQPERAAREWELFLGSEFARWMAEPGRIIHAEIPFLWLEKEHECLEGVIDLAVYLPAEKIWHVIDWKTNQLDRSSRAEMVKIYQGQIQAYVRALAHMLSTEVRGSLYLTASGQWIPVS